jgi:hypothetical protein
MRKLKSVTEEEQEQPPVPRQVKQAADHVEIPRRLVNLNVPRYPVAMIRSRQSPEIRSNVENRFLETRRRQYPQSGGKFRRRKQNQRPANRRIRPRKNREVQGVTAMTIVGEEGRKGTVPRELKGKIRETRATIVLVQAITHGYHRDDLQAEPIAIAEIRKKEIEMAKGEMETKEIRERRSIVTKRDHRESRSTVGTLGIEIDPAARRSRRVVEDQGSTSVIDLPML